MKPLKTAVLALALAAPLIPVAQSAEADAIRRACIKSDRAAASRPLCGCIQRVADQTLSRSDQRKAAKFFKEPQLAQDTRQSDVASNEAFWLRYKDFGATAAAACS